MLLLLMVFVGADGLCGVKRNTYRYAAVLRNSWMQIGGNKTLRVGVDGQHRELDMLATTSAVAEDLQTSYVNGQIRDLIAHRRSPVFDRHYDATTKLFGFGALQALLFPHTRYPFKDKTADAKWQLLSFEEYVRKRPNQKVYTKGVLNILATTMAVRWIDVDDKNVETGGVDGTYGGFRVFCAPKLLENGRSSCTRKALEEQSPQLSDNNIIRLCRQMPYAWVREAPDACNVNTRKMAHSGETFAGTSNLFYEKGKCGAHQCHRVVESRERETVGGVHAIAVTCGNIERANTLQLRLREVLDEVIVHRGPPPEALVQRNKQIVAHTLARRASFVAGDPALDVSHVERADLTAPVKKFLEWWNGDYGQPQVEHWLDVRTSPVPTKDEIKDSMFAAAVELDVLMARVREPSADDWFTCGECSGKVSGGILVHEILPRTYAKAFPTWQSMQCVNDHRVPTDATDRKRLKMQKKAWRGKVVFESQQRKTRVNLLCWAAAPVERLQAELTFLDQAGHGLTCIVFQDDMNPFAKCRLQPQQQDQQQQQQKQKKTKDKKNTKKQ